MLTGVVATKLGALARDARAERHALFPGPPLQVPQQHQALDAVAAFLLVAAEARHTAALWHGCSRRLVALGRRAPRRLGRRRAGGRTPAALSLGCVALLVHPPEWAPMAATTPEGRVPSRRHKCKGKKESHREGEEGLWSPRLPMKPSADEPRALRWHGNSRVPRLPVHACGRPAGSSNPL